jgi:hypothetical protein
MDANLLRSGKKMDFSQCKTYGELDCVLKNIFTNNPSFWGNGPLYLDNTGDLSNVIKGMLTKQINCYEHKFNFIKPDERKHEEVVLYNYCFGISKVRSNPLLPLVYYNAFLYMDSLGLSMHRTDNVSKIMCVRKNKYSSIFDEINGIRSKYDLDCFLHNSDRFVDIDETIRCECGTVEAYRVESGIFYGADGYIVFPFPTDGEIGRMYYFEMA